MSTISPAETAARDQAVRAAMERWAVPGLALGILQDGAVETFSYGVVSLETGWPVTPETLFQIGSISKVFTATLVMQLVDEGRLDLDVPVARYLPSLRLADEAATGAVTLRQLLTHTAGFYGDRFDDHGYGDDALTRSIATFASLRQYTPPGALWAYCNTGFQLAGAVIEAVLGTTFEAAMRERILAPLGLTRSFYFAHEAITYPVATGHNTAPPEGEERPATPEVAREWGRSRCRAAQGGLLSTVHDLLRFAEFHLNLGALSRPQPPTAGAPPPIPPGDGTVDGKRVLSEAALHAMQQPQVEAAMSPHWGIGWSVDSIDGVAVIGHGGTTNGFQARLTLVPERRFAFACLTNSNLGSAAIQMISDRLLEQYAGLRRAEPAHVTLPPDSLSRYAGRYERPDTVTTIAAAGDGLVLQVHGKSPITKEPMTPPPRRAVPTGDRTFLILDGETAGSSFDFILDDEGAPRFLRLGGRLSDRVGEG